ncbi:hypothetical protein LCGC14_0605520 [marine sediment metagenome]|uniref:Uncharacterized protein n=2 Tax=root TaxID=1 RepID=A0A9C9NKB7_9HYPH|nr:hypothetical protein [Aurantimonas coralicida]
MTDKKIQVRAGEGRQVHFPLRVIAAPGRRTLVLDGSTVVEVPLNMRFVRRSLRNGDLLVVQTEEPKPKAKPKSKPKAEAPPHSWTDPEEQ